MSDHRRRARSPVGNPARMSAPIISAGAPTVNYGHSADLRGNLHAIPTRREHFVSPRSSGASIETATHYKIKPERDTLALPRADRSRSRRSTIDSSSKPIIVTPTTEYNVVVGDPRIARESRESDTHNYREDGYIQPASSQHRHRDREYGYRGSRGQHTIDNADISERHPHDRETVNDRLLRVGSAREGQMYPRARPITSDTLVRHPDTVKDDYGDDGYGYTNPRDLVEYDLEKTAAPRLSQGPQRSRSRRESWDTSRGGRPVSISGYADVSRPYDRGERERGPPPSTRGFDKIPGDRNSAIYHMPGAMHMPMPHDHIPGSPLAQAPSSAYPSESLGIPQRRTSTRRPVSVYNDDRDRDRRERDRLARGEYDIVDGRVRRADTFETHEGVQTRGFGIRPDLMPPGNVVTVQPPASMERPTADRVERIEREEERLGPRDREKRYHDSGEQRYHISERDYRRDDRDRSERRTEPRPEHDDRDRKVGTGIAAGSIAAAAMGVGAPAAREPRHSDEERERNRARRHRRDSDQYYDERPTRRNTVRDGEPPVVDLFGRDPVERTPPRDRDYKDDRDRDSDSRREKDRESDNSRRDPPREQAPRRESPLQSEKVDLSDRYPVIERSAAKEDTHYPSDASRSSPPTSRRDRDREQDSDSVSDPLRRAIPASRRDRIYEDIGRETISSPIAMNNEEARDLRALREEMGLDRAVGDSSPPARPPKEPLETATPTTGFSRQSTDRISDRPLDPPSIQTTAERSEERSFVPPALRTAMSNATVGSLPSQTSRDSRPSYGDRGYSSTSTSSSSGSNLGTPRERSRERTRDKSTPLEVVSPPRSPSGSQATLPVRGILKPPRVFPELPAEERPGVAPLIDKKTGKNWDGREMADVPPSARWTKISRKLVNPEALEKGKERYEVRDDFVVVLRVLTKDEIQGYAVITQSIRAQREDEEREERRRKRGEDTEGGDERDERRRRRRDGDETEDERAERKRKERERDERRRKYDDEVTSEEMEERKAKEREERHRKRREERDRREGREDETADQAEERRRRERAERHERHRRERRERHGVRDDDEEYAKEREERRMRHRDRRERERDGGRSERSERDRERERERAKDESSESDTTEDERDDRRRRRRDRD